jgi:hypothetical protein
MCHTLYGFMVIVGLCVGMVILFFFLNEFLQLVCECLWVGSVGYVRIWLLQVMVLVGYSRVAIGVLLSTRGH